MRFAVALFALLFTTAALSAQTPKIAVANPAKIFNEIQETKDLQAKLADDLKTLQATDHEKSTKVKDMQANRDTLKPDSPQYNDINKQLMQATVEYEVWSRLQQADVQRQQKLQIKNLFEKITAATGDIAKQRGIDLVIAENKPEFPDNIDQINADNLRMLISQRNILYDSGTLDISNEVIAAMDAKYKSGK
ncbi:MAG TPA: OmpH family outer membrane protein [Tepidisphaeraceae bacterium]|nr:OmpH family outer membrane protein [Tepidisphaeraceae bacterium]